MTHTCHWPGCGKSVPPRLWGCREHWFRLPKALRDRIWATYRPGQEIDKNPSNAYLNATDEVTRWIGQRMRDGADDGWSSRATGSPWQLYRCDNCDSLHDTEEKAEDCCRPSVGEVWVCPVCRYQLDTEDEAKSCWRSHGLDLDAMRLTAAELEAAGQQRLSL